MSVGQPYDTATTIVCVLPFSFSPLGEDNQPDFQLRGTTHFFGNMQWNGDSQYYFQGPGKTQIDPISGVIAPIAMMGVDGYGRRVYRKFVTRPNPFGDPQ